MTVLLHISDPHFGTEQAAVADALLRLAYDQKPQAAILSGDITQRARVREFAAARRFIDTLALPTLCLPGNHDVPLFDLWSRLRRPYARYRAAFGGPFEDRIEALIETDDLLAIGVNTTRWWRHKDGEVSDAQIEAVSRRLRRASAGQLRIVVTHQPVHVTKQRDEKNRLHHHEPAIRAWSAAGADLILGGHIHLPYFRSLRAHYLDLPREVWAIQAGTALSNRVRFEAPNSVNVIRYDAGVNTGCIVERWDFKQAEHRFVLNESLEALLDR
ncbi:MULTISPECIES: metallophosphoesterase family protein [Hydrocarboniphaga]|uniref:Metallophosphoesterase n=1 Tax=Hydrocarboniphaga effusa AP103 TaxID=1172194 RepID=I8TER3_9GAMM|nr:MULTISPECIES: metallophosphoesterase [Hydrocarboniphaga]EIT72213.1 metallophosphoesterase [Hydrocarboniphaga effusa AP103]MDZ4079653.1 metallophosphoesterase [Hydrocarboniphaga sp.]